MHLLSEIAKDRLVIMVTHNPELAYEYSTRIVKLLDGEIIDDTNPYDGKEEKIEKEEKQHKKGSKKTSMGFKTAFSLSLNNLMTKKGRTLLTAFAGSIGIIGIALILSLSHGIQNYITKTEEETLSSYPLLIQKESVDMSTMLETLTGNKEVEEYNDDKIHSVNIMGDMFETLSKEVKRNNIKDFKDYIESNKTKIKDYTTSIQYGFNITPNLYKLEEDNITQVNPTTVLDAIGMNSSGFSNVYSSYMSNYNVFTELIDNDKLLKQQYDLVKGSWPKSYNELVLIIGENNQVSDYTLYSLGLLNQDNLKEQFNNMTSGKEVKLESKNFKMDELINLEYKLVLNTDYFEKSNGNWIDKRDDEEFMKKIIENAESLKIVGIIKPNPEAVSGMSEAGMVGYKTELMQHLVKKINETDIAKDQLANKNINIFTGSEFQKNKKFDMGSLSDEQLMALQQMSDEEIANFMKTYSDNAMATYEDNLRKLGISELSNPDTISIYPKDFESKEKITEIINQYNKNKQEEDKIEYTDLVGIIMSSVSSPLLR